MKVIVAINPDPVAKMLSAKFLVCCKFQDTSKSFKVCENIVQVSNSLDPGETLSNSASYFGSKLFEYRTMFV